MISNERNLYKQGSSTRPVIFGRQLVVSSGHPLASVIGLRMLDKGGNAFDAGVAMCFAQSLLEFQSYGFGGEVPMLLYSKKEGKVVSVNGNMYAPQAATVEEYNRRGLTKLIPGDGLLAAGVPPLVGSLISVLERYGELTLEQVLKPTVNLAKDGFPLSKAFVNRIAESVKLFEKEWPTSKQLFMPDGKIPIEGDIWKNPDLAKVLEKLIEAERQNNSGGRSAGLKAAIDRFYRGDIADQIVKWQSKTKVRDSEGAYSTGLLTLEDFANYETRFETPTTTNYRGYDVYKCQPWSQGPVMLQTLNILENYNLNKLGHNSARYIHLLTEAMKLSYADRERYYGDPKFAEIPIEGLLSKEYAEARKKLIEENRASRELRPGNPYPFQGSDYEPDLSFVDGRPWTGGTTGTRAIDKDGNMFSATPSGGWFHKSPIIEGMGFCLGTRMEMFWLGNKNHPAVLEPKKQPRTTLTPTLVMKDGEPHMVLGTPGGDQQDQWTLQVLLNMIDFDMNIQQAIDATSFHIGHMPISFYPRSARKGYINIEGRVSIETLELLSKLGHEVDVSPQWSQNAATAVKYNPQSKLIEGAASSRRETMYALGW